ncbi:MAG: hypothetical protein FD145_955 [Candidatus Saganbacteria bacterium]|uniref:Uncharacterized protein n=1 Tax=Candidatus Saganbacteria bacterium TaxID=2575572 RepID=A0A833L0U2_UNCSA|nr:MAG: hypothetical protein FD145_955 [Candidatus Saganbacteria bacterium]
MVAPAIVYYYGPLGKFYMIATVPLSFLGCMGLFFAGRGAIRASVKAYDKLYDMAQAYKEYKDYKVIFKASNSMELNAKEKLR